MPFFSTIILKILFIIIIGDNMRKYYLFQIRKEFYELYQNNTLALYKLLYNIYKLDKNNFSYGISLYNQLCETINVSHLKNYFQNKKNIINKKNKYLFSSNQYYEKTIMQINLSSIIILTNVNIPCILKIINYYNKYIFICDFNNSDYFWLKDR